VGGVEPVTHLRVAGERDASAIEADPKASGLPGESAGVPEAAHGHRETPTLGGAGVKECITVTRNLTAIPGKTQLHPMIEVVMVLTEPVYGFDATGECVKSRAVECVRFVASPESLRAIASSLREMADEGDAACAKFSAKPEDGEGDSDD
jgi:hypothetical protein